MDLEPGSRFCGGCGARQADPGAGSPPSTRVAPAAPAGASESARAEYRRRFAESAEDGVIEADEAEDLLRLRRRLGISEAEHAELMQGVFEGLPCELRFDISRAHFVAGEMAQVNLELRPTTESTPRRFDVHFRTTVEEGEVRHYTHASRVTRAGAEFSLSIQPPRVAGVHKLEALLVVVYAERAFYAQFDLPSLQFDAPLVGSGPQHVSITVDASKAAAGQVNVGNVAAPVRGSGGVQLGQNDWRSVRLRPVAAVDARPWLASARDDAAEDTRQGPPALAPEAPAKAVAPPPPWHYAGPDGQPRERTLADIVRLVLERAEDRHLVWRPDLSGWLEWSAVPEVAAAVAAARPAPPVPPAVPPVPPVPPPVPSVPPPVQRAAAPTAGSPPSTRVVPGTRRRVSGEGEGGAFSFEVAALPAGEFVMGSPAADRHGGSGRDGEFKDEAQRRVRLSRDFEVGVFPVTQALYEAVVGEDPSAGGAPDHAVNNVSWVHAIMMCNAVSRACGLAEAYTITYAEDPDDQHHVAWNVESDGFRLLTEAEWEYAARAGGQHRYPGSDDLDRVGWYRENNGGKSHPVGRKEPNAWGLHDMTGCVSQWCWDYIDLGVRPRGDLEIDPTGCEKSTGDRAVRGGFWSQPAYCHRVAKRGGMDSTSPRASEEEWLGFRLARSLPR